jgi:hypothetical protein
MPFDELLARIVRRVISHGRSRHAETVLSDAATAEADQLWQATQPANAAQPTCDEAERLAAARSALGWLYCQRWLSLLPDDNCRVELAHAIVFLEPLADDLNMIPEPLRAISILGASADVAMQGAIALSMLEQLKAHPIRHFSTPASSCPRRS